MAKMSVHTRLHRGSSSSLPPTHHHHLHPWPARLNEFGFLGTSVLKSFNFSSREHPVTSRPLPFKLRIVPFAAALPARRPLLAACSATTNGSS
jgi:hypothetical protein